LTPVVWSSLSRGPFRLWGGVLDWAQFSQCDCPTDPPSPGSVNVPLAQHKHEICMEKV
jgi:hypothetical protein